MKRIIFYMVSIILVFSLVACDSSKKESNTSGEEANTSFSSKEEETVEPIVSGENIEIIEENNEVENTEIVENVEKVEIDGKDPNRYKNVEKNPVVTMEMENGKKVTIELYPQIAPTTVENFISLINKNFYDGVIFHRVMPGFMAQGGDPLGNGTGGPGYTITGEFSENGFEQNNLKHEVGVISMARATDPNSAGSQFFIVTDENAYPSLDNKYAAFGKVLEGMDTVYEIVNSPVNFSTNDLNDIYMDLLSGKDLDNTQIALLQAYQAGEVFDRPINPPVIKTMTVDTFGVNYAEPEKIK